jgi:two-component sensor histidine kinase
MEATSQLDRFQSSMRTASRKCTLPIVSSGARTTTIRWSRCGLLVNELATNAAKHGGGAIDVTYSVQDGVHKLSVCDGGEGLPADFNPAETRESLGMRVVTVLVSELGGELRAGSRSDGSGACFTISFVPGTVQSDRLQWHTG